MSDDETNLREPRDPLPVDIDTGAFIGVVALVIGGICVAAVLAWVARLVMGAGV
jgi:hypothetical protein